MKNIIIFGAGGLGREVQWLIERINLNNKVDDKWNILGFIDDSIPTGTIVNKNKVLGNTQHFFQNYKEEKLAVVCAVGSSETRKKIYEELCIFHNIYFPNLIDPSASLSEFVELGKGNIICSGVIITVNVILANFCLVNMGNVIAHDVIIDDFVSINPGCNISGNVHLGVGTEVGTGAKIVQGISIGRYVNIWAGSVIIKNICDNCIVFGVPGKKLRDK